MSDTPQKITEENFELAFNQIQSAFTMLSLFDWQAFVAERQRFVLFMHITDPTAYRDQINSKNVADNVEAAKAAAAFVGALNALKPDEGGA